MVTAMRCAPLPRTMARVSRTTPTRNGSVTSAATARRTRGVVLAGSAKRALTAASTRSWSSAPPRRSDDEHPVDELT